MDRNSSKVDKKEAAMVNHFKEALQDPEVRELFKDKPYHMSVLEALASYTEKGNNLHELPWFPFAQKENEKVVAEEAV